MRVRELGLKPFVETWHQMQKFTENRDQRTEDELWLVEHLPVYTQGLAGKAEHILNPNQIEVVQIDRGGQVTYHGPGQVVLYLLLDLKRSGIGIRPLVNIIEHSVIALLAEYAIKASARQDAPGVYTEDGAKIASLGLKIRKGCTYHGLALNVAMDLTPFTAINPCGLIGMQMTQMQDYLSDVEKQEVAHRLASSFMRQWQHSVSSAQSA